MPFEAKRVLLTGGAGFIGSHVAEELLRRGVELTIVDNLDGFYSPLRKKSNLKEIKQAGNYRFSNQDIRSADKMRDIIARTRPDTVIHLAARAGVRPSIQHPLLYERPALVAAQTRAGCGKGSRPLLLRRESRPTSLRREQSSVPE